QGLPKARIEEAAARTQARIDTGHQAIVGVNKYRLDEPEDVPVLKVDNAKVRAAQIEKLTRLKAERDASDVTASLQALENAARASWTAGVSPATDGAAAKNSPARTPAVQDMGANLLALAINAARAKATVGEMSAALERAFQRHQPPIRLVTGVF